MLRDLIVVGAGPVGAALALALGEGGLDVVTLDARAEGSIGRSDRSLALSHGARLILERIGVWTAVAALPGGVTPISAIDISQRGGFGQVRLESTEQRLPALGYVVSYRALQGALDAALTRARIEVLYQTTVSQIRATPAYVAVDAVRSGTPAELTARLIALADGSGEIGGIRRRSHDYGQVALTAKIWAREPHRGVAFERFTAQGPIALLPEGDHYGLVWTTTPVQAASLLAQPDAAFLTALARHFGVHATTPGAPSPRGQPALERVADRRTFPLRLDYAERVIGQRLALLGNAAQALHPVAGQGFNLGMRDAYELAQELLATPRQAIGSRDRLMSYARRRRRDRLVGILFTHGLLGVFGNDTALLSWPRGLALTLLDCWPAAKRAFTRTMSFGTR